MPEVEARGSPAEIVTDLEGGSRLQEGGGPEVELEEEEKKRPEGGPSGEDGAGCG